GLWVWRVRELRRSFHNCPQFIGSAASGEEIMRVLDLALVAVGQLNQVQARYDGTHCGCDEASVSASGRILVGNHNHAGRAAQRLSVIRQPCTAVDFYTE